MTILGEILRCTPRTLGITPMQKTLLITIAHHYQVIDGLVQCEISHTKLAQLTGSTNSQVRANIKKMAGKFFVANMAYGKTHFYWLTVSNLETL